MIRLENLRLSWDRLVRVLADALMINAAFVFSLAVRFMTVVWTDDTTRERVYLLDHYREVYLSTFWILTAVCLISFALSGFYTYGRSYSSRYKALVIFQAVSLGFLISGFIFYFLLGKGVQETLNITSFDVPRMAFLIAWITTVCLVIGSRLWSAIWRGMIYRESQQQRPARKDRPENILVIGGGGYIGSALLGHLLDANYRVRLMDLLLFGNKPIAQYVDHPNLEIIQADFRQIDQVVEAVQGMDAVVHLGAIVGDPACDLDEKLTTEINVVAARMIAEIARSQGIERFVFASTCSVYGVGNQILDEHSTLNPVSLYARSKLAAERMLLRMAAPEFAPVILRFGTIYGFSGRVRFDLVVNLLTAKALKDGEITVFGGNQWRPFVHVDDAARAVQSTLEVPLDLVRGEVFNVGSNEQNYQIQEVGEIIHGLIPEARLINKGDDTDARDYRVNFDKIRNTLNFSPKWTLEDGIRQVADAFASGQVGDYRNSLYSNVQFLTDEGASRLIEHGREWMEDYLDTGLKEGNG